MLMVVSWQLLVYILRPLVTTCREKRGIGLGFKVLHVTPKP